MDADLMFEEGDDGDAAEAPEFCWVCWVLKDDAIGREKPAWFVDDADVWLS